MRMYPERPIVGVGAVVLDGSRVLLVRRANEPLKGEWSLPGGAVELGETLQAAIAREVREEAGIDVEVGPMVEVFDRIRLDDQGRTRFHYVLVDFVCRPRSVAIANGSDAAAVVWADVAALGDYAVAEFTVAVIQKAVDSAQNTAWPRA